MKEVTRGKVLRVLDRYAKNEYLTAALKAEKLASKTYYDALRSDSELQQARATAGWQLSDFLHEESARDEERLLAPDIDVAQVGALRERLKSRQWRMSRLHREAWGDKQVIEHQSKDLLEAIYAGRSRLAAPAPPKAIEAEVVEPEAVPESDTPDAPQERVEVLF